MDWLTALRQEASRGGRAIDGGDAFTPVRDGLLLALIACVEALDAIVNPPDPHTDGYAEMEAAHAALDAVRDAT